jgi:Polyketide cyclase / dehydrase and lipid transport
MARYQAAVHSRWPAAETFAYLATFSNAVDWDPGVLASEQLDPGPVAMGTRFRLVVSFAGRRLPLTYRVTGYQPDREVLLAATSGLLCATDKIVVTGGADGSAVSYAAEVRLRGPLRVLDPLLRPRFRAIADRAAAGLAHALEGR